MKLYIPLIALALSASSLCAKSINNTPGVKNSNIRVGIIVNGQDALTQEQTSAKQLCEALGKTASGLRCEFIAFQNSSELLEALENNKIDIAAHNGKTYTATATPEPKKSDVQTAAKALLLKKAVEVAQQAPTAKLAPQPKPVLSVPQPVTIKQLKRAVDRPAINASERLKSAFEPLGTRNPIVRAPIRKPIQFANSQGAKVHTLQKVSPGKPVTKPQAVKKPVIAAKTIASPLKTVVKKASVTTSIPAKTQVFKRTAAATALTRSIPVTPRKAVVLKKSPANALKNEAPTTVTSAKKVVTPKAIAAQPKIVKPVSTPAVLPSSKHVAIKAPVVAQKVELLEPAKTIVAKKAFKADAPKLSPAKKATIAEKQIVVPVVIAEAPKARPTKPQFVKAAPKLEKQVEAPAVTAEAAPSARPAKTQFVKAKAVKQVVAPAVTAEVAPQARPTKAQFVKAKAEKQIEALALAAEAAPKARPAKPQFVKAKAEKQVEAPEVTAEVAPSARPAKTQFVKAKFVKAKAEKQVEAPALTAEAAPSARPGKPQFVKVRKEQPAELMPSLVKQRPDQQEIEMVAPKSETKHKDAPEKARKNKKKADK